MATKLAKLRCDRLLLAYPANFSVLILVFVSHETFLARLFCASLPAAPGGNCPSAPVSYATASTELFL